MKTVLDIHRERMPGAKLEHMGTQWSGPCLLCGGTDRMALMPDRDVDRGGHWMCRHCCPRGDDGISLLRKLYGMSYREACQELGIPPKEYGNGQRTGGTKPSPARSSQEKEAVRPASPPPVRLPPEEWSAHAAKVCERAVRGLEHSEAGKALLASRGITLETARIFGIGWLSKDVFESRTEWGLVEKLKEDGRTPVKLVIPAGLTMPITRGGKVVAVIDRVDLNVSICRGHKYRQVAGGADVSLCRGRTDRRQAVLVVESYLDAVLAWQEAGDMVDVLALTGATKWPDAQADAWLKSAPQVLVNLDYDEAGGEKTANWIDAYGALDCPCVLGKDLTEQTQQGISVREWLAACMEEDFAEEEGGADEADAAVPGTDTGTSSCEETAQPYAAQSDITDRARADALMAAVDMSGVEDICEDEADSAGEGLQSIRTFEEVNPVHIPDVPEAVPAVESDTAPVRRRTLIEDPTHEDLAYYADCGRCGSCGVWSPRRDTDGTRYAWWCGTCSRDGRPVHHNDRCHITAGGKHD